MNLLGTVASPPGAWSTDGAGLLCGSRSTAVLPDDDPIWCGEVAPGAEAWITGPNGRYTDGDSWWDGCEIDAMATSSLGADTDGDGVPDGLDPPGVFVLKYPRPDAGAGSDACHRW